MLGFKVLSFSNYAGCRSVLCSRNMLKTSGEQRATLKTKALEKLGIPLPPKKPLAPYMRFAQEIRPKITGEFPKLSATEIVKRIASEWHNLDHEQKKVFKKQYLSEYEVYSVDFEKYKKTISPEQQDMIASAKKKEKHDKEVAKINEKKKKLGRPKRPLSAFLLFLQDRKASKDISVKNIDWLKEMSEEWKNISPESKEKYMKSSDELREKYYAQLTAWEASMIREGNTDVVRNKNLLDNKFPKKSSSKNTV